EGIFHPRSISSRRRAPTSPNSPREIALGEVAWKLPIQTEIASKSKVRHTLTFFAMADSSSTAAARAAAGSHAVFERFVAPEPLRCPADRRACRRAGADRRVRLARSARKWRGRAAHAPPDGNLHSRVPLQAACGNVRHAHKTLCNLYLTVKQSLL